MIQLVRKLKEFTDTADQTAEDKANDFLNMLDKGEVDNIKIHYALSNDQSFGQSTGILIEYDETD